MSRPSVVVLRAAGANCDQETAVAFELAGASVEIVHVNQFTRGGRRLREFQILVIPGGFTYGDDVSAGRIAANEVRYQMADQIQGFVAAGRLVLGICNGFQVLAKAGLLPGAGFGRSRQGEGETGSVGEGETRRQGDRETGRQGEGERGSVGVFEEQRVALAENLNGRFQCRWVRLRVNESASPPFLSGMDGRVIEVPIAHGEGRFWAPEGVLEALKAEQRIAFQYCGPNGESESCYNVNGSAGNAAGISGHGGRVLGLMPHPERHIFGVQHPRWTREGLRPEGDGLSIFRSAVRYLQQS